MNATHLKHAFLWAIIGSAVCLVAWEMYWRTQTDRYNAHLDDDRYLWAEHRRLVETATKDDVIIIGSSRTALYLDGDGRLSERPNGAGPLH